MEVGQKKMNRYKATLILILVSLGYLISFPFHRTFIGGLLSAGFCASMIGGFADWYGITAIFRKPLRIPYRTELIPKNREKIFEGLSTMVSEELLKKEYLKKLLDEYNTSDLIIKFLSNKKEKANIKNLISKVISENLNNIEERELGEVAGNLLAKNLYQFSLWEIMFSSIDISIKNGYDDKVIDFVIDEIKIFLKTEDFKAILTGLVEETKNSYEKDMVRRVVVNAVVLDTILNLSSDKIAEAVQNKIIIYFTNIKNHEDEDRLKLKKWLYAKIDELKKNEDIKQKAEAFKNKQIDNMKLSEQVTSFLKNMKINGINGVSVTEKITGEIDSYLERYVEQLADDESSRNKMDFYVKKVLDKFIDSAHKNLGKLVRENLDKYSNDMLVDLIESRAGNDLQLIRINGSVVGGLVGIIIFLITYKF